jgi:hypothetical protein
MMQELIIITKNLLFKIKKKGKTDSIELAIANTLLFKIKRRKNELQN